MSILHIKVPDNASELWFLLNELLKVNSRRLFDLILTAHIKQSLNGDNLALVRVKHALGLGA